MTRLKLSILFTCTLLVIACSGESSEQVDSTEYLIDSTGISKSVSEDDLKIVFNPPVNWKLSRSDLSDQLIKSGSRQFGNSGFVYKPLKLFLNTTTNSTLFVGVISENKELQTINSGLEEYKEILRLNFRKEITSERVIKIENLELTEFRIKRESIYSYKLLFENKRGKIIQLDYTTLEKYLPDEKTAIESSISTIGLL